MLNNILYFVQNTELYKNIITNPPYICYKNLNFYHKNKKIPTIYSTLKGLKISSDILKKTYYILPQNATLTLEHGYNQAKIIRTLIRLNGFNNTITFNDINNINRLTYLEK